MSSPAARAAFLASAAALIAFLTIGAAAARAAEQIPVVVVERLDLPSAAGRGAVGLLVPGAGPETSREQALTALVRGRTRSSLRGRPPAGPVLIQLSAAAPGDGPAILLELPPEGERRNDVRYPIAVVGTGRRGLLSSGSTRLPGLVSIADVAPTALGLDGALAAEPAADPLARLAALDARIEAKEEARLPVTLLAGALALVLAAARPRAGVLSFGTGLAANLGLGWAASPGTWGAAAAVGLSMAAGAPLLALALRSRFAVGVAFAALLAAYLGSMAADPASVALSPLGPSQAGRFYGVSNLLEAMLLLPALAGAAFVRERLGWAGFAAVGLLALATVSGSRFGADGGGALVLGVAFALLAVELSGRPRRLLAPALAAAAAVVAAAYGVDRATGGSSHVTRAAEGGGGGLGSDLADRFVIAYERSVASWDALLGTATGLVLLAALAAWLLRSPAPRELRALPLALVAAASVSLLVNDSPVDVLLTGSVASAVAARCTLAPRCAAPRFSPSLSSQP